MGEASATEGGRPKTHTPFRPGLFRKTGEAFDLAGKGVFGLSGLNLVIGSPHPAGANWLRLSLCVVLSSGFVALGIYLQAKAEETR
jgi:hypothetical protein